MTPYFVTGDVPLEQSGQRPEPCPFGGLFDEALSSEGKGRVFESRRARHDFNDLA
jgi:hypothetical protein